VTCPLKARIVKPEETPVAREWSINTFPWQRIHGRNKRRTVVGGVFYGSILRSYKKARRIGTSNQNDCAGEGQQQFGGRSVGQSASQPASQSESPDESEVNASQWWPDMARSQWPGVATIRSYETVSSQ
jgi:hypothetical protein